MNNIKKTTLAITLFSLLSVGFTGCGSDAEEAIDAALNNGTSTGGSTVTPSGSYDCEQVIEHPGHPTMTMRLSASGKLVCTEVYGYPELEFIDDVNELVVSQLISTEVFDSNYASGTATTNLAEGTEHIVGTDSTHGSVDCINTYDVPLPITFYSASDVEEFYIDDYQLTNTTCPSWINDDDEYEEPTRVSMSSDIVITDSRGETSTISTYFSY